MVYVCNSFYFKSIIKVIIIIPDCSYKSTRIPNGVHLYTHLLKKEEKNIM